MNSETVDLIATDPPFNKGKDFHATPDSLASGASFQDRWSWDDDVDLEWVDQIADDWPNVWQVIESSRKSWGDDMGAFLCYMGVRLIAMRRLLKPTGSIYLHCDSTASHYLKMLMDAIYEQRNFIGEIVWNKQNGVKSRTHWGNENDSILVYAKKKGKHVFNAKDPICRVPFSEISLSMHFNNQDDDGRWFRRRTINGKDYIYYADEGRFIGNLWNDVPSMVANTPLKSESTGYPTQKPLALYERIIKASSNKGDMVLDPFAGCATTCIAAERIGREWVGIDIWDESQDIIVNRLEDEGLVAPKYTRKTKKSRQQYLFANEIHFTAKVPRRTDDGETDAPYLKTKNKLKQDEISDGLTNKERKQRLIDTKGSICQGCGRKFDDARYLELDHNNPRADGGSNNITNRILLCSPCNRLKSHTYTLSGLIKKNRELGYMKNPKLVESLRK